MEFYQLDHEKQFKFNLKGLFVVNTLFVASFFSLGKFVEPGFGSLRVSFLSEGQNVKGPVGEVPLGLLFHRVTIGVTILIMAGSELSAHLMRPSSTAIHPMQGPTDDFVVVQNNVPFSSLNLAIVLGIIVIIIRDVVFNAFGASGIPISAVLTTLLVSNKKARKHVLLRLRQKIDVFSIGGNNTVHPVVSIALVRVRDQMDESAPRHNAAQIYMV